MNSLISGIQLFDIVFLAEVFFAINLVSSFLLVLFERRNPSSTWAWLMVLSFFPFIGFVIYIFFGRNLRKYKIFSKKKEKDRFQNSFLNKEENSKKKNFNSDDPKTKKFLEIIHLHYYTAQSPYTNDNKVEIFIDGKEKFAALIKSLESAKSYIHIEYYMFKQDNIGNKILAILEEKAEKGIEVKVIYDALGTFNFTNLLFKELIKKGGQVVCFFPSTLHYINLRMNYRNHRKIAIIDGNEAFIGGFNIGDEYLGEDKTIGYWRDTHLKIYGGAVRNLQRQFFLDWMFASGEKVEFKKKYFSEKIIKGNTGVQIVPSGPDSTWASIKYGYFKIITSANKSIYIQTPYFIPDESILEAIKIASLSGVDVKLMIPEKADHRIVHHATFSYMGELLQAGVTCYTYNRGFLHSKMIVSDGVIASVGSANFDMRSFEHNFEVNAFIYDEEVVKKLEATFIEDIKYCNELTLEKYNKRSLLDKTEESLSRLLAPLL